MIISSAVSDEHFDNISSSVSNDKTGIKMTEGFQCGYIKKSNTHGDRKPAWLCTAPTMYVWRAALAASLHLYPDPGDKQNKSGWHPKTQKLARYISESLS